MKSKYFSEKTVKEELPCSRIRWALECHEDTYLALHIMFVRNLLMCHPEVIEESYIDLVKMTQTLQNASESRNSDLFKHQLVWFMEVPDKSNLTDTENKFAK